MKTANLTRDELLKLHQELTSKAAGLMKAKNQDYAHEGDVFRNFRLFGGLGILVRLSDKLARLRSFEENNSFAVEDEKLIDTIADTINYAVLYYAFKQEGKPQPESIENEARRMYAESLLEKKIVKDGPYCYNCDRLAEFRVEVGIAEPFYCCGMCRVTKNISLHNCTLMGRL